jgi:cytochrome c oxidase cbb3-type subunit III
MSSHSPNDGVAVWRGAFIILLSLVLTVGAGLLWWRDRDYRPQPAAPVNAPVSLSELYAGGKPQESGAPNDYDNSAFAISEGKRLYQWFNCSGCHANGGGDIGPPLMDEKWIYGSKPENIRATLLQGRPNGMPAFRQKMTDSQAWQITAYVRSMSGQVPMTVRAGRNDDLQAKPSEALEEQQPVQKVEPVTSLGPH